jgi:flagellar biosynthesis chaperone FliJ
MQKTVPDCYVKSSKKHKQATKFSAGSSEARKYVYSYQLRFLSKMINERQTANSLLVDNMDESQVTWLNKREMI